MGLEACLGRFRSDLDRILLPSIRKIFGIREYYKSITPPEVLVGAPPTMGITCVSGSESTFSPPTTYESSTPEAPFQKGEL